MIDGDRFRLAGSHAQGLKSMSRGCGVSADVTASAESATSANNANIRRAIACACGRGDVASGTARALRCGRPTTHGADEPC